MFLFLIVVMMPVSVFSIILEYIYAFMAMLSAHVVVKEEKERNEERSTNECPGEF